MFTRNDSESRIEETIILDMPGQAELTTHHNAIPRLLHQLEKAGYRVGASYPHSSYKDQCTDMIYR